MHPAKSGIADKKKTPRIQHAMASFMKTANVGKNERHQAGHSSMSGINSLIAATTLPTVNAF